MNMLSYLRLAQILASQDIGGKYCGEIFTIARRRCASRRRFVRDSQAGSREIARASVKNGSQFLVAVDDARNMMSCYAKRACFFAGMFTMLGGEREPPIAQCPSLNGFCCFSSE